MLSFAREKKNTGRFLFFFFFFFSRLVFGALCLFPAHKGVHLRGFFLVVVFLVGFSSSTTSLGAMEPDLREAGERAETVEIILVFSSYCVRQWKGYPPFRTPTVHSIAR